MMATRSTLWSGNNGSFGGDETALRAIIERTSQVAVVDDVFTVITSSTTFLDVLSNDPGELGFEHFASDHGADRRHRDCPAGWHD